MKEGKIVGVKGANEEDERRTKEEVKGTADLPTFAIPTSTTRFPPPGLAAAAATAAAAAAATAEV